jgi:putative ABC transport system substrate-binding protein
MDRRHFLLTSLAGALAGPLAAGAQQAVKVYRLGILSSAAPPLPSDRSTVVVTVPAALRDFGYVEGHNLLVERRFAVGKREQLPALASDLVQARMDVILAMGDADEPARAATKTIPIVMMGRDPVGRGLAKSLGRSGTNVTGVVIAETVLADKRLALLKEAVPRATRIALLSTGDLGYQVEEARKAASALGVKLVVVRVPDADYQRAFGKMMAEGTEAVVVLSNPALYRDRHEIIALAAKHRLPAIYDWRNHADEGGLMSYGSNLSALHRRLASYIDRIFKGANPSEIPLEQPTSYELVINLKTAKALGLTIPPSVLARADQIIE